VAVAAISGTLQALLVIPSLSSTVALAQGMFEQAIEGSFKLQRGYRRKWIRDECADGLPGDGGGFIPAS
jgi:hypothetical protein